MNLQFFANEMSYLILFFCFYLKFKTKEGEYK